MRILLGIVMAWSLLARPATAQVQVLITLGLPAVLPPMVVVQPGFRVVSELDEEVYFVDGWYWVRRGPHWYRTHDHRGQWVWVVPSRVPATLVRIPPGRYRRLHREEWKDQNAASRIPHCNSELAWEPVSEQPAGHVEEDARKHLAYDRSP